MNAYSQINSYSILLDFSIIILIAFLLVTLSLLIYNKIKNKGQTNKKTNIIFIVLTSIMIIIVFFIQQFRYEIKNIECKSFFKDMANGITYTQCIKKGYKNKLSYNKTNQICKNDMKKIAKLEKKEPMFKINKDKIIKNSFK
jgi:predicted PurR-regulated permease PerM